jgi:ATP-dependent DNA helicase RecG
MKLTLNTPVTKLHMVGPTYARRLKKLEIKTIKDLLYHAPHRYIDFTQVSKIGSVQAGEMVTIKGRIKECKNVYTKTGKVIQKAIIKDDSGQIEATWFNQPFIPKTLRAGKLVSLSGEAKTTRFRRELVSPEYELGKNGKLKHIHTGRLVPVYPQTEGLSSKWLRSRIAPLLNIILPQITDWLPQDLKEKENLISLKTAIRNLHFPDKVSNADQAKKRLAFDEMLTLQLLTLKRKRDWQKHKLAKKITIKKDKLDKFQKSLTFRLTNAQIRCLQEILEDLRQNQPMNRLLLGDVGSGKTVVAAIAIYAMHLSGARSILMAPTEILTFQHEKTIKSLLEPLGLKIAIRTGSRKEKLDVYDVLIGTHALIYKTEKLQNFGLVIIDEQHRFGVEQRAKLIQAGKAPHTLTMTATPIPRTVALTLYGDLDLSVIDEMPPGRIKIKTWVVPPKKRQAAYNWIREQIKKGDQAFIVCPLIETSEHETMLQVKAATEEFNRLSKAVFPDLSLELLHGRMKSKEKEQKIQKFRDGKSQILVSTPVVEVGIDIPHATIMMIEGAERFGLAQLHQLRGRVGRGEKQSYCLLFTSTPSTASISRLKSLATTKSGQELAELDLKLRGPGEIYGTRQHGFLELKFSSLTNTQLISKTRAYASTLLKKDPNLRNSPKIKVKLRALEKAAEPN